MIIPQFTAYDLAKCGDEYKITKISDGKVVTLTTPKKGKAYAKLKDDLGNWKSVSLSKLISLCDPPKPPEGFVLIPGYKKTYISKSGITWIAPGATTPLGSLCHPSPREGDYPVVAVEKLEESSSTRSVHILLALTFIDSEYLSKGLCVMHLDDNKNNYALSNLKVSTYSENNKAAYDTGVNPSKKQ